MYEAADVDGAGPLRQFWTLILPLLRPTLVIAVLFRTLDALRVFDVFQIVLAQKLYSMASFIYYQRFYMILLPLTAPAMVTTGLMAFIAAWNEYLFALTFTSIEPTARTVPVVIALFTGEVSRQEPFGEIMAAAVLREHIQDYDYIIVHDTQYPGIINYLKDNRNRWVYRCHIETTHTDPAVLDYGLSFKSEAGKGSKAIIRMPAERITD